MARMQLELGELREALTLVNLGLQLMWIFSRDIDQQPEKNRQRIQEHLLFRQEVVRRLLASDPDDLEDLKVILEDTRQTLK
ncbi:hypothetical protein DC3_40150 [Deinococcus cellulosilyticus NBRC 106333 = KACC 11606]|uniref:Uncharacterized protein n=1 Tax=Deinococcus cellulosilyticus (strain DSM 18568 / NBRC 106333 / KACC 11606 / 5516J-15) TaxID=1223518 RepID=A0A511N692_DEIC1|nr:hypothetical protein DC3_40150 [Deinococcus cellulosilyticus NBRC 106333 = KACC 11606]